MIRWRRIIGLCAALFCLLTGAAEARQSTYARALLLACDKDLHEATFEGQVTQVRKGLKMQLRFTLQASTPDAPKYRKVAADGFGVWITAPASVRKYSYDKTVQALLVPASYRVVVDFRWRSGAKTVRTDRAFSPVCRQPDLRPDLVLRDVRADRDGYVAVVFNRGKQAAGGFDVDFQRNGTSIGSSRVTGVAPGQVVNVFLPGPRCGQGAQLTAVVDPRSEVDEADEDNDTLQVAC
jgi:CARDB